MQPLPMPPGELPPPRLAVGGYRLRFHCQPPMRLPHYPGFAWRGAFGLALKNSVCVMRPGVCDACLLRQSCAYSLIFETPPPPRAAKMRRYQRIPHPFALRIDGEPADSTDDTPAENSGRFSLGIHLFGQANRQLPYIIHAFGKAGEQGIGPARQPFHLQQVEQYAADGAWRTIYHTQEGRLDSAEPGEIPIRPLPGCIRIRLDTPFRSKSHGALATPANFHFHHWFGPLLRRVSMLATFYGQQPWETDFAGLMQKARQTVAENTDLHWRHLTRYSSRHGKTLEMGGLLGGFELDSAAAAHYWPVLWLGQWTHAGKGASMGLGAYRIEAASLSERMPAHAPAHTGDIPNSLEVSP